MTLAFSTELKGQPTHFVEKIWEGLLNAKLELCLWDISNYVFQAPNQLGAYVLGTFHPKLHTIRKDEKKRWKEGRDIHMVINNRTPNRFQFAPVVKCVSTQEILIKYSPTLNRGGRKFNKAIVWIDDGASECLWIDGEIKNCAVTIEQLALNDGFDSVYDFFEYFSEDFTGKIIHWTNLKY